MRESFVCLLPWPEQRRLGSRDKEGSCCRGDELLSTHSCPDFAWSGLPEHAWSSLQGLGDEQDGGVGLDEVHGVHAWREAGQRAEGGQAGEEVGQEKLRCGAQ